MRTQDPRSDDVILHGGFLWFPMSINGETRWWEHAVWEVHYSYHHRDKKGRMIGKPWGWADYRAYQARWKDAEKKSEEAEEKLRVAKRRLFVLEKGEETLYQLQNLVSRVVSHNEKQTPAHMGPEYTSNLLIDVVDVQASLESLK